MNELFSQIFNPGFFNSEPVHVGLVVGGMSALVSAVVGVMIVIRGQSFAGHSLSDVSLTGGSAAFLIGVNPLIGYLVAALIGAGAMDALGGDRARTRDVATGVILGATLGVAALFLYLGTTMHNTTGVTTTILFGSVFSIDPDIIQPMVWLGLAGLVLAVLLFRPLLLTAVSSDMARARGVPVRSYGLLYLLSMVLAVSMACMTVGAILSTALLIGPAAAAVRMTKRPVTAVLASAAIGVVCTGLGIVLAYDSFNWPIASHGWPVSFFIVMLVFLAYLVSGVPAWLNRKPDIRHRLSGAR